MFKKRAVILIIFLCMHSLLVAQNRNVADSLIEVYDHTEPEVTNEYSDLVFRIATEVSDPAQKLFYARQLVNLGRELNNKLTICRGYLNKGYAYRHSGDLNRALESFFTSAEMALSIDSTLFAGQVYIAIADVYSVNGHHNNSISYYKKGLNILEAANDSFNVATAYLNMGDEYYMMGLLDSAIIAFVRSGSLFNALNSAHGLAYNKGNMGLVYAELGKLEQAEDNMQEAISILLDLGDFYPISVYYLSLAKIYRKKNLISESVNYAIRSYRHAKNQGLTEQLRDASHYLSELSFEMGEYMNAYLYLHDYIQFSDSIGNDETIRRLADMRTEFEVSQKQHELDLIEKQKKAQAVIVFLLIGSTLIISLIAFLLFRNNKKKVQLNKILNDQKVEMQKQRDQLDQLNTTKDKLFSIISHDLRGPIGAINGVSGLIRNYIDDKDELTEIAGFMEKSATKITELLNNLLNWAIQQQDGFPYNPEKLHLKQITSEIINIYLTMAHEKDITILENTPDFIKLWADKNSTTTIIRNLINNAIKFTNPGGRVIIDAELVEDFVLIRICDTGIGIPQEQLEQIFQFRGNKSRFGTNKERGFGLGLSLCYEFVQLNKGFIDVNSKVDQGTCFKVKLPLSKEKAAGPVIDTMAMPDEVKFGS